MSVSQFHIEKLIMKSLSITHPSDLDCIMTITNNPLCIVLHLIWSNITGRFFEVIFACTYQGIQYQGASRNDINNQNTEESTFRASTISHTGWIHQCIAVVYLKPVEFCLIEYLIHHDQMTPDIVRCLVFNFLFNGNSVTSNVVLDYYCKLEFM